MTGLPTATWHDELLLRWCEWTGGHISDHGFLRIVHRIVTDNLLQTTTETPPSEIAARPEEPMERRMLRDLISHWREFGPQHGFDEKIESYDKAIHPPFVTLTPSSAVSATRGAS